MVGVLPVESARGEWEWVANYDPAPDIRRMTMPSSSCLGRGGRPDLFAAVDRRWQEVDLALGGDRDLHGG